MSYTQQSRQNVAQYLTNLDEAFTTPVASDMSDVLSWDPFADQNNLALYTAVQPAIVNEGEKTTLSPADFTSTDQTLGAVGGGHAAFSNGFPGMDLSLEQLLFADCNASSAANPQPTPTGLRAHSDCCTPEHHFIGLPPLAVYSEGRAASTIGSPQSQPSFEDSSGGALQEDKRQRNTAASARFRVKKKQRDSVREKSVKEVQDNISRLEANVAQLENENKWLKNLAAEKMERMMADGRVESKTRVERSDDWKHSGPKDGVGT